MIFNFSLFKIKLYKYKRYISKANDEFRLIKKLKQHLQFNYSYLIHKYDNIHIEKMNEAPRTVWIMWWQGEDFMPESVKICYNSVRKYANGYTIILLTEVNIEDYISLPQYIKDKIKNGTFSLTHLSDLIRSIVLCDFGGLWLDSTILVTQNLPDLNSLTYWSPKWKLTSSELRKYPLWYGLWKISSLPKLTITQCIGIWYSKPRHPIFMILKDFWLSFSQKENTTLYYWTLEVFLIGVLYDSNPYIKKTIDDLQFNNPKCLNLSDIVNEPYSDLVFEDLKLETSFFYLRRKSEYRDFIEEDGSPTLYHYLKSIYLNFEK